MKICEVYPLLIYLRVGQALTIMKKKTRYSE